MLLGCYCHSISGPYLTNITVVSNTTVPKLRLQFLNPILDVSV